MAILNSCCCWKSIRTGSLACGFYSLIYHTFLSVAGTFHIENGGSPFDNSTLSGHHADVAHPATVISIVCSGLVVFTAVLLLVGLCTENRLLLIPWLFMISITTVFDLIYTMYTIGNVMINPLQAVVITVDFFICALNVYCILCVVSLYQEYTLQHRTTDEAIRMQAPRSYESSVTTKEIKRNSNSSCPENGLLTSATPVRHSNLSVVVVSRTKESSKTLKVPIKSSTYDDETVLSAQSQEHIFELRPVENGERDSIRRGNSSKRVQFHPTVLETFPSTVTSSPVEEAASASEGFSQNVSQSMDTELSSDKHKDEMDSETYCKFSLATSANDSSPLLDHSSPLDMV